jgi:hypothetical protein
MATLHGEPVDRPAVSFYEVGGFLVDPSDPDPYNVYNAPSWQPLLQLAEEKTDLIRMGMLQPLPGARVAHQSFYTHETYEKDDSRFVHTTLRAGKRTMTQLTRRERDLDTTWVIEPLLKDLDDLKAFLELPREVFDLGEVDLNALREIERAVGDRGIMMVDSLDPLGEAAGLFEMGFYTILAITEVKLVHCLLERFAETIYARTERVAKAFPGRLWRIPGPEYAIEPYLPPHLFEDFVVGYTGPMVDIIHRYNGIVRLHCHGRLRSALPHIAGMGVDGIDPIEPPPQGDVQLAEVRRQYGEQLVLFGNIEISDLENLPPDAFRKVAERAVREGTEGHGRGFVLMPTACPYGREITANAMRNYETLIEVAENA